MKVFVAAALLGASALLVAAAPAQYLGRQQDDLFYVVASQELARGSYHASTIVGRPPLTMIPPGWPALLLPLSALMPERLGAYQALALLLQAALPWAVWLWARRRLGELEAVLVALLSACGPHLLSQAGTVMSETPYLLLSLAVLALPASWSKGALLGLLTLMRPAALSFWPAAVARQAGAGRVLAPAALAFAAWCAWSYFATSQVQEAREFALSYQHQGWLRPLSVAFDNLKFYAASLGGAFAPKAAALPAGLAALAAALWSAARALRADRADSAAWALWGAAGMHAVWAWQYDRYWIPLLPFLWLFVALASGRAARFVLGGALVLQLGLHAPGWAAGTSWRRPELPVTYDWLSRNIPPSEAFASAVFVRDGFYAGRPSGSLPDLASDEDFAADLRRRRLRWVLRQESLDIGVSREKTAELRRRLDRAASHLDNRTLFALAFEEKSEGARVYRLR